MILWKRVYKLGFILVFCVKGEDMDITFNDQNLKFNYRVVGVIIHDGKVLFQKPDKDKYWALVGGKCQLGELSSDALVREIKEEIDTQEVKVERLLWIVENFFALNNQRIHEISLYYLVNLGSSQKLYKLIEFDGIEREKNIKFKWFEINELEVTPIKPDFIKKKLLKLNDNIDHLVVKE